MGVHETCEDCLNKDECDLYKCMWNYQKHSVNAIVFMFGIHIVKICKSYKNKKGDV